MSESRIVTKCEPHVDGAWIDSEDAQFAMIGRADATKGKAYVAVYPHGGSTTPYALSFEEGKLTIQIPDKDGHPPKIVNMDAVESLLRAADGLSARTVG